MIVRFENVRHSGWGREALTNFRRKNTSPVLEREMFSTTEKINLKHSCYFSSS